MPEVGEAVEDRQNDFLNKLQRNVEENIKYPLLCADKQVQIYNNTGPYLAVFLQGKMLVSVDVFLGSFRSVLLEVLSKLQECGQKQQRLSV